RRFTNRPSEPRFIRNRVRDAGSRDFARVLRARRPHLVVCTAGGAAALAGAARAHTGQSFPIGLVVTGFRAHRHWARPEGDWIFVASDAAKLDLIARGIVAERIVVAGTPLRSGLSPVGADARAALRARLGLSERPVLLVSSGATLAYRAFDRLLD